MSVWPMMRVLLVMVTAAALGPRPAAAEDMVRYTVQRGDTFDALARAHFIRSGDWPAVARANRVPQARRLRAGQVLAIPKRYLRYRPLVARLAAFRGEVSLTPAGAAPVLTKIGAELGEGAIVSTGAGGFASFEVSGVGHITLPSMASMRIDRLRRYSLGDVTDRSVTLLRGRARVIAPPGPSGAPRTFELRARRATAAIRGTEFIVSEEPAGDALSVYEGVVTYSPAAAHDAAAIVGRGYGAFATDAGVRPPQPLLPKVDLQEPGRLRTEMAARFAVTPIPEAARYRFAVGLDASLIDTVADTESTAPLVAIPDLPDGNLYVRVTAVSAEGVEGGQRIYAVRRRLAAISVSAAADGTGTTLFRWVRVGDGGAARLIIAGDADLEHRIVDTVADGDRVAVSRLPAGTYWWAIEQRLVTDSGVERVLGPVQELVVSDAP